MNWLRIAVGLTAALLLLLGAEDIGFCDQPEAAAPTPFTQNATFETGAGTENELPAESRDNIEEHPDLGTQLPLWSCIPFAGMLLSIALWPLLAPTFWQYNFSRISAGWALALAIPFTAVFKWAGVHEIIHILLADYLPFIILLWSLYTVSGGILLRGTLKGTPLVNAAMLLIGTLLASWMGTTGAAMLLIRPFLRANKNRKKRTFMVVFFIFLVANTGGALTPLGDPPLFLGFLHGVSFFWPFRLAPQMLTMTLLLLLVYVAMDSFYYFKEKKEKEVPRPGHKPIMGPKEEVIKLRLEGKHNFLLLAGIVAGVLFSGVANLGEVKTLGIHRGIQDWARDAWLILMGVLSILTTSAAIRQDNGFSWHPIREVAYLFIGIFVSMIPALLILKAGSQGALAFITNTVTEPWHYFWVVGGLSGFLDNAPTYLTFFNTALGSLFAGMPETEAVGLLMTQKSTYLAAISCGSVFFGAFTYIGNAPNFMVRSIAEEAGTPMPSFFGYMFGFSFLFLLPCFIILTWLFF